MTAPLSILVFADPASHICDQLLPALLNVVQKRSGVCVRAIIDATSPRRLSLQPPRLGLMGSAKRMLRSVAWRCFRGRGPFTRVSTPMALPPFAARHGVAFVSAPPKGINDSEFVAAIRALEPDFILLLGCEQIVREDLLTAPRKGIANFHYSLLPAYRGRNATVWPLIEGAPHSGFTFHFIGAAIDEGDAIYQEMVPIYPGDTDRTLTVRILSAAEAAMPQVLEAMLSGSRTPLPAPGPDDGYYDLRRLDAARILDCSHAGAVNQRLFEILGELSLMLPGGRQARFRTLEVLPRECGTEPRCGEILAIDRNGLLLDGRDSAYRIWDLNDWPALVYARAHRLEAGMVVGRRSDDRQQ